MKTTIAGALYAIGKALQQYQGGPSWLYLVGQVLEVASVALGFAVAKDFNKTGK